MAAHFVTRDARAGNRAVAVVVVVFVEMDVARIVGRLADFLDAEGVPVALVGAHAFLAYGVTRSTVDLDLLTEQRVQDRLVAFMESLGYETLHRSPGYSNHLHADASWGRVDVVYVDERTSRALFGRAKELAPIGGHRLKLPSPEHLVAMKVQAVKNDPGRTLKDLSDIRDLLRLHEVDEAEVRAYFDNAGLGARYDDVRRR